MLTGVVSLTNLVSELFISSQNNDFPKLVSNLIVAIMAPIQATLLLIASIALARAAVKPAWAERLLVVMHGLAVGVLSAAQTIFLITNFAFVTSADPINFAPTPLLGTVAYVVGIALGALGGILAALVMRDVVRNTNTAQALAQLPSDAERAVPRNTVGILGALRLMFFGAPTSQAIRYGRQLEGGSSMAEQPKDLQQLSDDNPLGEDGFMNQRLVAQTT